MAEDAAAGDPAKEGKKQEQGVCTTCFFATLDFFATVGKGIVATYRATSYCVKETVYPIKETVVSIFDRMENKYRPYKAKVPYVHVTDFEY
ncbi:unnamed protein product [Vitrella brassicaformis CCMP3155]|uniref:Uncharacterized protein n=2 Tax=Vitrella brassicaformis TaxID=1169539 RepID=A0A0G4EI08_VITBC|nr:unnamed protein product [Vitrella brassicaformis CCMP3155]|eukprot:CEL95618.1 unnamed protein product [Vitrella brassicaformis CCMP3155]